MPSAVFDLATILGALDQIDRHLGSPVEWHSDNPMQAGLLRCRDAVAADVRKVRRLDCCAAGDADVLNSFLADREFASRFKPLAPPLFGVASAVRRATRWPEVGTSVPILAEGCDRRGFRLESTASGYALSDDRTLAAMPRGIMDEGSLWLLLGRLPDGADGFEMFEAARNALAERRSSERQRYASVTLPEVRLTVADELPWLSGMTGNSTAIGQAVQEIDLRIDRAGAEPTSEVAAVAGPGPVGFVRDLVIDRPFMVFWTDDSSPDLPLAVARFDFDAWSDWDSELADKENAELEAADASALKAAAPPTRMSSLRRRLLGRK